MPATRLWAMAALLYISDGRQDGMESEIDVCLIWLKSQPLFLSEPLLVRPTSHSTCQAQAREFPYLLRSARVVAFPLAHCPLPIPAK